MNTLRSLGIAFALLASLAAKPAAAQTGSVGNTTGMVVSSCGTVTTSYVVGNPGPITVDPNGRLCTSGVAGTNLGAANIVYSGPWSVLQTWLNIPGLTLSGTATQPSDGQLSPLHLYIGSDTVNTTLNGNGALYGLSIEHASSGGALTGNRSAFQAYEVVNGKPTVGGGQFNASISLLGISTNLNGATGVFTNYNGSATAGNSNVFSASGATFLSVLSAHEFDIALVAGASAARKIGIFVVQTSNDAVRGAYEDAAIEISSQANSTTWTNGILFGGYGEQWPFGTDSTLIGVMAQVLPAPGTPVAKIGIDFSGVTFTAGAGNGAFKSTGFLVDPSGNITGIAATLTGALTYGGVTLSNAVTGTGNMVLSASPTFSGTVTGPDSGTWTSTALTATEFIPTSSTVPTNGMYLIAANNVGLAVNSALALSLATGNSGFQANQNSNAVAYLRNFAGTAAAQATINIGQDTSASYTQLKQNSSAFSGGLGANAFAIIATGGMWLQGGTTTGIKIDTSGNVFIPSIASAATTSAVCVVTATGALSYDGTIGTCTVSDETLKNIGPRIDRALDRLLQIDGIYFTFKDQEQYGRGRQIGVGAQTVERVFPELVGTDSRGIKSADYQKLTGPIIEALRELKDDYDNLRSQVRTMRH